MNLLITPGIDHLDLFLHKDVSFLITLGNVNVTGNKNYFHFI